MRVKLTFRQIVGYAGFVLVFLLTVAAAIWRSDILQAGLDPGVPFQTYEPPPAPDYRRPGAWALWRLSKPGEASAFFVHSTTYHGGDEWNGPIDDPEAMAHLRRVVLPNYAGPFARAGSVSAPLYRQASLYTRLTGRDDARDARAFAYRDIEAAFDAWLAAHPQGPLVLAGVEQGGELVERLVRQRVANDPAVLQRLVGVYLVDALVADQLPATLPACASRNQAGCVVGWAQVDTDSDSAARRRLRRALVWDDRGRLEELAGRTALCVNPVSGARSDLPVAARSHVGAANATGLEWGLRPAFLDRLVATQCRDGLLRHNQPRSESFAARGTWNERRKARPYNLFYADIEADVMVRLAVWRSSNPYPGGPPSNQTAPPAP